MTLVVVVLGHEDIQSGGASVSVGIGKWFVGNRKKGSCW